MGYLAAQFGYLPGALWILIGCVQGGGVHDMVVLFASVRHKRQSLATIASKEIGPTTGAIAGVAVLFILILTLAGLSLACISAMHEASWPLFGISNQLLAACGLIVCTTMLIRLNRGKYALCSAIPGVFMAVITFWAGYVQVMDIYLPKGQYLLAGLAVLAMVLMLIVFIGAFRKWYRLLGIPATTTDGYGETVKEMMP